MKLYCLSFILLFLLSCQNREYPSCYNLIASDHFLSFPIDNDTKSPYNVLDFEDKGKKYLSFLNGWKELLIYDVERECLVKKIIFEDVTGRNNGNEILSYNILDFNTIFLSTGYGNLLCLTDTTARIISKIRYLETSEGQDLVTTLYPPIILNDGIIYLHQGINLKYGNNSMGKSPLGVMVDTMLNKITSTPLYYLDLYSNEELVYATHGNRNWCCYDGKRLIYSYDTKDSLITLDTCFKQQKSYWSQSKFIDKVSSESHFNWNLDQILKRICETPSYGNIIYDKYRNVYYRIAYPEVEFERNEDFLEVFRSGRKQFSIIILDKDLNVVGETLFPPYTYNPKVIFVDKDGLYISISHYKREDYSDDWLRFQRIDLVEIKK